MASLNVLFNIQGEGKGHLMQAVALAEWLRDAGHSVIGAHVGHGKSTSVPSFLQSRLQCEITSHASPGLRVNMATREMDLLRTSADTLRYFSKYVKSARDLNTSIEQKKPDVIVNFYEPLIGFVSKKNIPTVAIAHQYMFYHPSYPFTAGNRFQRWGARSFTDYTARSADKLLALSLYPTFDMPERKLRVVPPLLRQGLFDLTSEITFPFYYLAYVWRPDLLGEVREWCKENPRKNVDCFVAGLTPNLAENIPANLRLHPLDDNLFLQLMAGCSGVATTAGFETCAEAYFLDKPLLMVPTHLEQRCNALDAVSMGGARMSTSFKLDQLDSIPCAETQAFKVWAYRAPETFVTEIEKTAGLQLARKRFTIMPRSHLYKAPRPSPIEPIQMA